MCESLDKGPMSQIIFGSDLSAFRPRLKLNITELTYIGNISLIFSCVCFHTSDFAPESNVLDRRSKLTRYQELRQADLQVAPRAQQHVQTTVSVFQSYVNYNNNENNNFSIKIKYFRKSTNESNKNLSAKSTT